MTQPRIAVVMPIHNGLASTQHFLAAYRVALQQSPLRDRCTLHVVDDGSTDGSREWIAAHEPAAVVLRGDGSLWWSGSVNLALRALWESPYSHMLLFNNDNQPRPDYFSALAAALDRLGADRIIAAMVINTFPAEAVVYGGVTFDRRRARYLVNPDPQRPLEVNTAGGMGVLIPLQIVREVGLFDAEHFPQKSGDTDFYLRAERAGHRVHYCPSLVVYNDNRTTGFSDNTSVRGMLRAYSFPKGYMHLGVDARLLYRHAPAVPATWELVRRNVFFIGYGVLRMAWRRLRRRPAGSAA